VATLLECRRLEQKKIDDFFCREKFYRGTLLRVLCKKEAKAAEIK
jgi:hypothetical protein